MFNKPWLWLALIAGIGILAYVLLKPRPITIETTAPVSNYSQCCRNTAGEAKCVNQDGATIEYAGTTAVTELSLCPDGEQPSNKPDFSRHQILSPSDVLASADCCAVNGHSKRCTLPNGHQFEMPIAKTEAPLLACTE